MPTLAVEAPVISHGREAPDCSLVATHFHLHLREALGQALLSKTSGSYLKIQSIFFRLSFSQKGLKRERRSHWRDKAIKGCGGNDSALLFTLSEQTWHQKQLLTSRPFRAGGASVSVCWNSWVRLPSASKPSAVTLLSSVSLLKCQQLPFVM